MKKASLSLVYFLGMSFILSGLQGSLYFLPIAMPYFWFIIFTFYSFKKSLLFSLFANFLLAFIIISYSSLSLSLLIILINLLTIFFVFIRERFHTSNLHISIAAGGGCFVFLFTIWAVQCLFYQFYIPPLLSWLSISLMTLICSPPLIGLLNVIDNRIYFERIDTLQNLRI